jgi:hypothetical protein
VGVDVSDSQVDTLLEELERFLGVEPPALRVALPLCGIELDAGNVVSLL